ncbi:dihydrofolate reductase domain-containing protein [Ceratobasidium sp. AG-Ba]|nr:dihydrofolate reductase domain-containing protein [Ceratobasidium sp. AG-Ba]
MSAARTPPQLTLVVAATLNNGIGVRGGLPWRLPREMAYFAQVTKSAGISSSDPSSIQQEKNAVIMGRKSWESIPTKFRPLKDRLNVVISSQRELELNHPGPEDKTTPPPILSSSFEDALARISDSPLRNIFVIGGASIYAKALEHPTTTRILLTRILEPAFDECDVFFPDFEKNGSWTRASHSQLVDWVGFDVLEGVQEEKGIKYEFQLWVRKAAGNNSV